MAKEKITDNVTENKKKKKDKYNWVPFYEEFANRLLEYKDNRTDLIDKLNNINVINNQLSDVIKKNNKNCPDIDPFTIFALFNKRGTKKYQKEICESIATVFDIVCDTPTIFEGTVLYSSSKDDYCFCHLNQKRRYNPFWSNILWNLFDAAIKYSEDQSSENLSNFTTHYLNSVNLPNMKVRNITIGLYLIRPEFYLSIIEETKRLIDIEVRPQYKIDINIGIRASLRFYLHLCDIVKEYIETRLITLDDPKERLFVRFTHQALKLDELYKDKNDVESLWKLLLTSEDYFSESTKNNKIFPKSMIYECFVSDSIKKWFKTYNWFVTIQHNRFSFFQNLEIRMIPDLLIRSCEHPEFCYAILDAKCKVLEKKELEGKDYYYIERNDRYQLYAYAKAYKLNHIWLLYPLELNEELKDEKIEYTTFDDITFHVFFFSIHDHKKSTRKLNNEIKKVFGVK